MATTSTTSSSTPTTTNVYNQSIAPELLPYETQLLGNAQSYYFGPNAPGAFNYTGQRVADFSPLQTQAFNNIQQMQPNAATDQAAGLAGLAGTNQFTGANVNQYMSPYMQDVVNTQSQAAVRNYAQQLPGLASVATGAGGLGGSREALVQANMQQGLQNQLAQIQAQGSQNAFANAQNQFNTANQNQLQAAGLLGNLGQQQFQQAAGINTALLGAGSLQQQQEQTALNNAYQNAYNQWQQPQTALANYSDLLRNTPMGSGSSSTYQSAPNMLGQVAGLTMGLGNLFGALG